jgi:hypothetical protein
MTTRIKLRRDTAANWLDANPILAAGEPGLETDTGKVKYGDGTTAWAELAHAGGDTLNDDGSVTISAGSTAHWVATQRRNDYDTEGCALRYDSEGNLYSLAQTSDNDEDSVAVITKYSPAGAVVWQHSIDDLDPLSIAIDSTDRVYITGETGNGINLFKFNTDGTVLWKKFYSAGTEWIGNAFIEELNSSSIVLVGNTEAIGGGTSSGLVFKINATTGAVITQKTITNPDGNAWVAGIDCVDNGGTIFVTGRYYDDADDKNKMFVDKLDSDLNRVWSKSLESPNTYDMNGGDCASDAYGNIYAVGSYQVTIQPNDDNNSPTGTAAILTKLNSSGVVQWTRRIGPGPCGTAAVGVNVSSDNYLYLTSMTTVRKTDDGTLNDYEMEGEGQTKLLLAKYDLNGAVVWQRYVDAVNVNEFNNDWPGLCVATFDDKVAVQFYGETWDTTVFNYAGSDDQEDDFFVVQLPADGTELTIGKLDFTASRVPGRFVTHVTTDSPTVFATFETSVLVENGELELDSAARVANDLVKSEVYEYTFGADGTLTIPNDGDVKLTQTQMGYLMAIGGAQNYNDDIYVRAVVADADGNLYVVGEEDDDNQPVVAKIDPQGGKVWNVRIIDDEDGNNGRANGVTLDSATGNVVVVCEMYGNYTYSIVVRLDQDTGQILEVDKFSDTNADVYLNDVVVTSANTYVVAGSKNGEFSAEQSVTAETGSTTSTLIVLRSEVVGTPTNNWQITGNGFSTSESLSNVEYYTGLTSTVRQGTGATFNIIDNGNGTYSAGIETGGTNYRIGHKIQIPGSSIGGVDVTNDITITVDSITGSGIIDGVSNSGTAAGSVTATYSELSGTNYQVGSGATFYYQKDPNTSSYSDYYNFGVASGGSNYANDDVLTISGTQLGGTSPANDLVLRAYTGQTALSPVQSPADPTGTAQTTTWKLITTTAVDFSQEGSWTLTYPLSRENFLATPTWQRTFGTNDGDYTDRLYAVAVDSGGNIIAVGEGYGEVGENNSDSLATVFKFNSTGTLQWARQLNETNDDCYAKSVTTIGTDIYVVHESNDDGETVISKLSSNGTVVWQRITDSGDDSVIANAGDGNVLVAIEAYNSDIDTNALKVIKMTPSGETVYKRWLMGATDEGTNFKNGRCLTVVGDSYYVAGYFYANDYDSALVAKLPVNGDGIGEYGSFRYSDVNANTGSYNWPSLNGINYDIDEVDLTSDNNYAGALAVAPYVNTGTTVTVVEAAGDFLVDLFDVDHTVEVVRDIDGGRIVFADGSTQSTSAQDIPQRTYTGQKYTLGMKDRGHHIFCQEANDSIIVPYDARVPFPIGTVITIVNDSGSTVYINTEGSGTSMFIAGDDYYSNIQLNNLGIATLLKVGREKWVISGNVQPD